MRLIDADALLEKFNRKADIWTALTDEDTAGDFAFYCKLADAVEDMPTVDAVPVKHGRWEEQTVGSYEENSVIADWQSAKCSECGLYLTTPYLYYFTKHNFCPECGAKMDGERMINAPQD